MCKSLWHGSFSGLAFLRVTFSEKIAKKWVLDMLQGNVCSKLRSLSLWFCRDWDIYTDKCGNKNTRQSKRYAENPRDTAVFRCFSKFFFNSRKKVTRLSYKKSPPPHKRYKILLNFQQNGSKKSNFQKILQKSHEMRIGRKKQSKL